MVESTTNIALFGNIEPLLKRIMFIVKPGWAIYVLNILFQVAIYFDCHECGWLKFCCGMRGGPSAGYLVMRLTAMSMLYCFSLNCLN